MTLQGILREVAAAQRRADRAAERNQRQYFRAVKLQAKANELDRAAAETDAYEERLQQLTAIHHAVGESMDWAELGKRAAPSEPQNPRYREKAAAHARDVFKAGFFQRLFGHEKKLIAQLDLKIIEARSQDEVSHKGTLNLYRQQLSQWQALTQLATAMVRGETSAYQSALDELQPLQEMEETGCVFAVSFSDAHTAEIELAVENEQVIPSEAKSLTRTGKLSVKALPQSKRYDLYQDYVCGCALRSARELFSFLPLQCVVVNVNAMLLNPATGHLCQQTILSVGMPRSTIEGMQFTAVDPSDAMKLFPHRMGFKRSQGFFPIIRLAPSEYPKSGGSPR